MKKYRWVILSIVVLLMVVALSYLWATTLMDTLFAFRSPLAQNPVAVGAPTGTPLTRQVVAIMVDGLRTDTANDAAVMPFLNQLRAQGAAATVHSRPPSYSFPAWSVLLIGAWPELSDGPAMNPAEGVSAPTWTQDWPPGSAPSWSARR